MRFLGGEADEALQLAADALALADELQLDELRAHALTTIGSSKNRKAPSTGHVELERALAIATETNSPLLSNILNNLAVAASMNGDTQRADELYQEAVHAGERNGDRDAALFARGNHIALNFERGQWDKALEESDRFVALSEKSPHYLEALARRIRGCVRLARGDHAGALDDWNRALEQSREIRAPQSLLPTLLHTARGHALLGHDAEARELASEAVEVARANVDLAEHLGVFGSVAHPLGIEEAVRDLIRQAPESPWKHGALAQAEGDFMRAADVFAGLGDLAAEAEARFAAADVLIEAGRRAEGEEQLEKALAFYRSVGATFFVQRGEALLEKAATG